MGCARETYSKPMCEWMRRVAQRRASVVGFSEPAAKGAMVKGMRAPDMILRGVSEGVMVLVKVVGKGGGG